jgi:hypothetical protein
MTRNRDKYPAIPFTLLYDENGGQSFDSTGAFHTWDTEETKTSHFQYDLDTNRIYLKRMSAGYYEITFECSFETTDNAVPIVTSQLYKNGTAVTGAQTQTTVADGNCQHEKNQQSIHFILFLKQEDYIQIKTTTNTQSAESIAETSRLLIKFIPVHGWNNSNGGRVDYRGEVLR